MEEGDEELGLKEHRHGGMTSRDDYKKLCSVRKVLSIISVFKDIFLLIIQENEV